VTDGLLDTTFFIDLRRGRHAGARAIWERVQGGELSLSYCSVTALELWKGRMHSRDEELFYESMFDVFAEEPITVAAAKRAGLWLRDLDTNQARRLLGDALIAAVALEAGIPVYTVDSRDFARFPASAIQY
jgi:predicted nucleic acid-binding protein